MQTLISFLRGVNMTGHNSIKMADLSKLYCQIGFCENKTYIQSGNVIFKASIEANRNEIASRITQGILQNFGYNIPIMIRDLDDLKHVKASNPYLGLKDFDPLKMAVIFLLHPPTEVAKEKMKNISYPPDQYYISDNEILTYCPNGFGKTKLYTNFFENKMGVIGTARNWKTVTTILDMAENFMPQT